MHVMVNGAMAASTWSIPCPRSKEAIGARCRVLIDVIYAGPACAAIISGIRCMRVVVESAPQGDAPG